MRAALNNDSFPPSLSQNILESIRNLQVQEDISAFDALAQESPQPPIEGGGDSRGLYNELPEGAFRLLEIMPPTAEDEHLVCRLHVCNLEASRSKYEAISYTWRMDTADRRIYHAQRNTSGGNISGSQILLPKVTIQLPTGLNYETEIGANLHSALMRLRYRDRPRTIWADAICICQEDEGEKGRQVRMMGTIFAHAFRVLVWLGDDDGSLRQHYWFHNRLVRYRAGRDPEDDPSDAGESKSKLKFSETAFLGICRVVNAWLRRLRGYSGQVDASFLSAGHLVRDDAPTSLPSNSPMWANILLLFEWRWFQRLWVIQEISLARRAVVIWGGCEISWEWIGLAAAIIRTNYGRIAVPRTRERILHQLPSEVLSVRQAPPGVLNAYLMYRLSASQSIFPALEFSFHELLGLTRPFSCENELDRVFGLLGLQTTDDITSWIIPDYNLSPSKLYQVVAEAALRHSSSLSILSSVNSVPPEMVDLKPFMSSSGNPGTSTIASKRLPSWVPSWKSPYTAIIKPMQAHQGFTASLGRKITIQDTGDLGNLCLRGVIVDRVHRRTNVPNQESTFARGIVMGERRFTMPLPYEGDGVRLDDVLKNSRCTQRLLEDLAMTLTAGKDWYGLPIDDIQSHVADFAHVLLLGGLRWTLATPQDARDYKSEAEFGIFLNRASEDRLVSAESEETELSSNDQDTQATDPILTAEDIERLGSNGNADLFLDAAATACGHRAFFRTESGLVGLGPNWLQTGDSVCILFGADVPFVIRPKNGGYRLIGECYIHDLMRGQAVDKLASEAGGLTESWIELV